MKRPKTTRRAKRNHRSLLQLEAAQRRNPDLPVEIILIILSYLPSGISKVPYTEVGDILPAEHFNRLHALSSLSQTCRSFWFTCRSLVWEHFAVCAIASIRGDRAVKSTLHLPKTKAQPLSKQLAMRLAHMMKATTISNPSRASFVRIVTVSLSNFSAQDIFPQFARALASFPNLEVVQILTIPREYYVGDRSLVLGHLRNAFRKHVFATVHTLTLTCPAADILPSFPSVRILTTRDCDDYECGRLYPALYLRHVLKRVRLHLFHVTALYVNSYELYMKGEFNDLVQIITDALPKIVIFPFKFQLYNPMSHLLSGIHSEYLSALFHPQRLFDFVSMPLHRLKCLTTIDFEANSPDDVHSSDDWAQVNRRQFIEPAKALLREIHSNVEPLPAGVAPTKRQLRIFYSRPVDKMEVIEVV